jgi:hypothetical protein
MSWTKGPQEPLNKTSASIKLFGDDGIEIPMKEWDKNSKQKKDVQ